MQEPRGGTLRLCIALYLRLGRGTQQQAADSFQLSLPAVKKIWKQYKQGGIKGRQAGKSFAPQEGKTPVVKKRGAAFLSAYDFSLEQQRSTGVPDCKTKLQLPGV